MILFHSYILHWFLLCTGNFDTKMKRFYNTASENILARCELHWLCSSKLISLPFDGFFFKKKKDQWKKKIRLFLMMVMAHMCTPLSIMRPNSEWMTKNLRISLLRVLLRDPLLNMSITSHRFQIETFKKRGNYIMRKYS